MRIEQLELTRYGAFTDHIIDFGSADKTGDFHIKAGSVKKVMGLL